MDREGRGVAGGVARDDVPLAWLRANTPPHVRYETTGCARALDVAVRRVAFGRAGLKRVARDFRLVEGVLREHVEDFLERCEDEEGVGEDGVCEIDVKR